MSDWVAWFETLGMKDVPRVGGKNASLGEMIRNLTALGVSVPGGFATTADAYRAFLEESELTSRIRDRLAKLDVSDVPALTKTGREIREWILAAKLPARLEREVSDAYRELEKRGGQNIAVAVRSSATAEDLPEASFAGQQETYLNISGPAQVLAAVRQVFASLFNDRAISYRVHHGFAHDHVALSAGIQQMVRSDRGASGVAFTLDTESGFRDVVFITAAYGLGETVVQGAVNPDEFYVHKPTLRAGRPAILKRTRGEKAIKMIYAKAGADGATTETVPVEKAEQLRFCINDEEVQSLARQAVIIEEHYGRPMDIEWGKDGVDGKLYILQARPETVKSRARHDTLQRFQLKQRGEILIEGRAIGARIGAGTARVVNSTADLDSVKQGEVLVADMTDPDWEPVMKRAAAIVTNRGGRTCHAAIVARELGIPAVVGCGNATQVITTGQKITVSCSEGDTGFIYDGAQEFDKKRIDLTGIKRPKTRIMVNIANPEQAFEVSKLPSDGVGLARLEFIINNSIRIHPRALIDYDTLEKETQEKIDHISAGYPDRKTFYIQRLAEGIGMIAAAFHPRQVIVRFSDFKSNEYASLIGGASFEPDEENPMIGFRGAGRYFSPQFSECFALECVAIKTVREVMGLDNVAVMIPFVRTVEEGINVLKLMAQHGLKRGQNRLNVYMMCELPSNALLADEFLEHFDGFSIGSNDLTQLTLGVDRDSSLVTSFDERNPAVLSLMEMAITACKKKNKYIGICGQAPSDYPEIARWLVQQGIDSISLNPDSVLAITQVINEIEQKS